MNFRELRDQVVIEATGVKEHLATTTVWGISLLTLIGMLLFVGAMGKSAQLPLYVWLPDAMAGPTPVSALIHAATMVTAGVYMVARLNFLFVLSPSAMGWVALIGALTAIFAATIGFFQYDIKKVLAYSTVSQLGFMFIGVGTGAYWAGVYHLMTHAFFKATLFLGSGSVILGCHHEQDMRKMGGLKKHMPITRWTYLIATVAIAGFPIANGFYSKDEILWKAFTSHHLALFGTPTPWLGPAIYVIGLIAATGTSFYMYRSYYMTFTGEYRGGEGHGHETTRTRTRRRRPHAAIAAVHASNGRSTPRHRPRRPRPATPTARARWPRRPRRPGRATPRPRPTTHAAATATTAARRTSRPGRSPWCWPSWPPARCSPSSSASRSSGSTPSRTPARRRSWSTGSSRSCSAKVALRPRHPGHGVALPGAGRAGRHRRLRGRPRRLQGQPERGGPQGHDRALEGRLDRRLQQVLRGRALRAGGPASAASGGWPGPSPGSTASIVDGLVNAVGAVTRVFANLDGAIDKYVVDGAVNGVANVIGWAGGSLRLLQTGRIQTYLYGALGGALVVVLVNFLIS